jgi:hypothetical protein
VQLAKNNETIVSFRDTLLSAEETYWMDEHTLKIEMRKYPGNMPPAVVILELDKKLAWVDGEAVRKVTFPEIKEWLKRY